MPPEKILKAKLSTVAYFPPKYFLENLALRQDNSILVTVANRHELWFVPPVKGEETVTPVLLFTFAEVACGITEVEPDIFYVATGSFYTTHEAYLHRLDLRNWNPGAAVHPEMVLQLPPSARGLNGSCLIAPGVLLLADSFASLIWRVDLPPGGGTPTPRVWLKHESMGYYPGQLKPEQPGVNGVRFAAKTSHLYYTATAKKLFMRVPVDPETNDPAGEPELVVAGRMGDDFCIDENAGVIYLATHPPEHDRPCLNESCREQRIHAKRSRGSFQRRTHWTFQRRLEPNPRRVWEGSLFPLRWRDGVAPA